ncbi:DUF721 domain-containing protein [Rubritalea marina]|uniref:DUF721 domain-containing protein n=1 Tax=Rubritalea marina TaxID=361055 RepID=UPI00037E63B4|nr:DUF721 domain-containing protein [Rubritalea marina]
MAKNNPSSQSNKKQLPHTMKWLREMTLRQWRHGDPVLDPNRNVHIASEHVDSILKKVGVHGGLDEQRLRQAWQTVAGDFVAKHAEPESFRNGVLVLKVVQPSMRFHLEQLKGKMLNNFHRELGKGVVKQIRFKIG